MRPCPLAVRVRPLLLLAAALVQLLLVPTALAEIWQWTDAEGVIRYTPNPDRVPSDRRGSLVQVTPDMPQAAATPAPPPDGPEVPGPPGEVDADPFNAPQRARSVEVTEVPEPAWSVDAGPPDTAGAAAASTAAGAASADAAAGTAAAATAAGAATSAAATSPDAGATGDAIAAGAGATARATTSDAGTMAGATATDAETAASAGAASGDPWLTPGGGAREAPVEAATEATPRSSGAPGAVVASAPPVSSPPAVAPAPAKTPAPSVPGATGATPPDPTVASATSAAAPTASGTSPAAASATVASAASPGVDPWSAVAVSGGVASTPPPAPEAPAPLTAEQVSRRDELEELIARDEEALKALLSDTSLDESGFEDSPELREIALRLPALQAELRALKEGRAPEAPEAP